MSMVALSLVLALTGCGEKKPAASPSAGGAANLVTDATKIPKDDNSRTFAERLLRNPAKDFKPTDANTGAKFIYNELNFKPDNTWAANATMYAGGEEIACAERGEWAMEAASDANTADMVWTVTYTNCPSRPQNNIMRLNVHIEKGEYTFQFR